MRTPTATSPSPSFAGPTQSAAPAVPGRRLGLFASLCLAAAGLSACAEDDPGQVEVEYVLGNGKTCQDLGVVNIEGVLVANALGEEEFVGDEVPADPAGCETPGILTFDTVPVGNYDIKLFARDAQGVVVMDNGGKQQNDQTEVVGSGANVKVANIRLADSPARVLVRWRIADGFVTCQEVGIDRFRVDVWDEDGTELLHTNDIPCVGGEKDARGYQLLTDPSGRINGKLFGEASVVPLNVSGQQLSAAARFDLPGPVGPGYAAYFTINCPNGAESCAAENWEIGS